jgi:hypothetical protein
MQVLSVYMDCDKDSLIFLSEPIGPACHTNAPTCYFQEVRPPQILGQHWTWKGAGVTFHSRKVFGFYHVSTILSLCCPA